MLIIVFCLFTNANISSIYKCWHFFLSTNANISSVYKCWHLVCLQMLTFVLPTNLSVCSEIVQKGQRKKEKKNHNKQTDKTNSRNSAKECTVVKHIEAPHCFTKNQWFCVLVCLMSLCVFNCLQALSSEVIIVFNGSHVMSSVTTSCPTLSDKRETKSVGRSIDNWRKHHLGVILSIFCFWFFSTL